MPRPTLRDVHVNRPLTNLSIAYSNESYIADQVFPVVSVEKKSDLYFTFDRSSWFRDRSGPRAPGTRAARADYALTTASYICINDSLAKTIPDEVRANSDQPLRPDITATNFVTDGLLLGLEIRVANIVTTCGNWANASNPTTVWSADNSDPWGEIDNAVNQVVKSTGRMPNVAAMSWDVWRHLRQHPDFLDRIKYTRAGGRLEVTDLQGWFGFDKVLVGTAIKDTAAEGVTESRSFVWGNAFWCGYVPGSAALEEPASGYTLVWGNREISTFREEQEYTDVVTGQWFTDEIITASEAGAIYSTAV